MSLAKEIQYKLKLAAKHADLIALAYENPGSEALLSDENSKKIDALIKARIFWRNGSDHDSRMTSSFKGFLDHSLKSQKLNHIDSDLGSSMIKLEHLTDGYFKLLAGGNLDDADRTLEVIKEISFSFCENIGESGRRIWRQIDSDFSGARSLQAKIQANNLALIQVNRLLDGLDKLILEDLLQAAGQFPVLRRLFGIIIPSVIKECMASLSDALSRLRANIYDLKKQEKRAKHVELFNDLYMSEEGYIPRDYSSLTDIPTLFCKTGGRKAVEKAYVKSSLLEDELTLLLEGLRKERIPPEISESFVVAMKDNDIDTITLEDDDVRVDARIFLERVLDTPNKTFSAIESYLQQDQDVNYTPSDWLIGLFNEYCSLEQGASNLFIFDWQGQYVDHFDGNFRAIDIHLSSI